MSRWWSVAPALALSVALTSCSSSTFRSTALSAFEASCADITPNALTHYDQMSAAFLDELTRQPGNNFGGNVVWNTRFYLESLLTAYQATNNRKYIQEFLASETRVMNLSATLQVLDAPDPTAPGSAGPSIEVMGWPTLLGSFGTPVAVPTGDGNTSMYIQSLKSGDVVATFQVIQQGPGSLQLAWLGPSNEVLQANTVSSVSDLKALAAQPLIYSQTAGQSLGRIIPTGVGLPAVGQYPANTAFVKTVWHEQTGGILLPAVEFLLLAKDHPEIADTNTVEQWTSKVLSIASSYEDELISDGGQGLRFRNPQWLPNAIAGVDAAADYIFVEAKLRLLLFELTGDPHELSLAKGLVLHQQNLHWASNAEGWLQLQVWPCIVAWSNRTNAAAGSIWDQFQFDPSTAAPSIDASFVVDFLDTVEKYQATSELGLRADIYDVQRAAFIDYMVGGTTFPLAGPQGLMRASFPVATSTKSDAVSYSAFAAPAWLPVELSDPLFTNANWRWMKQFGLTRQGYPVGYFLRAWARSEAAQLTSCKNSKVWSSTH